MGASRNGTLDLNELVAGLTGPYSDELRELVAEGVNFTVEYEELLARADTWPE